MTYTGNTFFVSYLHLIIQRSYIIYKISYKFIGNRKRMGGLVQGVTRLAYNQTRSTLWHSPICHLVKPSIIHVKQ